MELRSGIPKYLRFALADVLLPLLLASCSSWGVRPDTPGAVVPEAPQQVRLGLASGDRLVLYRARITADSVVGVTLNHDGAQNRVGVPLSQVQIIEVRRPDQGMTLLAMMGALALAAVVYVYVVISGDKS